MNKVFIFFKSKILLTPNIWTLYSLIKSYAKTLVYVFTSTWKIVFAIFHQHVTLSTQEMCKGYGQNNT